MDPDPSCSIIPDGTVVLDGGDGQLYRQDNGRLRAMTPETWRALGSPPYTTYPSYMLQNCDRGNPVMLDFTTPAPSTTTPSPVVPSWDPTLYVIIHRDTYMDSGKVHVLTARYGSVSLSPYTRRDLTHIFLISTDGRLRNASGSGVYVEHAEGCLVPTLRDDPTERGTWTITPTGEAYVSTIVSSCGAALHTETDMTNVDLTQHVEGTTWFVVPVGRSSA
jgi:hypothetical protein